MDLPQVFSTAYTRLIRLDTLYAQSYSRSTPVIQYKLVSCLALAHFIHFPATNAQIKTHLISLTLPKHTNIVCTLLHDKEIASEFDRYLNSRHNNIKFTLEFEQDNKAVFTLNVNYIQLNYDSIYHTPFDFIQLWFYSHLRKSK